MYVCDACPELRETSSRFYGHPLLSLGGRALRRAYGQWMGSANGWGQDVTVDRRQTRTRQASHPACSSFPWPSSALRKRHVVYEVHDSCVPDFWGSAKQWKTKRLVRRVHRREWMLSLFLSPYVTLRVVVSDIDHGDSVTRQVLP